MVPYRQTCHKAGFRSRTTLKSLRKMANGAREVGNPSAAHPVVCSPFTRSFNHSEYLVYKRVRHSSAFRSNLKRIYSPTRHVFVLKGRIGREPGSTGGQTLESRGTPYFTIFRQSLTSLTQPTRSRVTPCAAGRRRRRPTCRTRARTSCPW